MKDAKVPPYQPVNLNRDYLAGRMLEQVAKKHHRIWEDLSLENRVTVRQEFIGAIVSLEETFATGNPAFLTNHACWLRSRFEAGKFPGEITGVFFSVFRNVLSRELPQDYRERAGTCTRRAVTVLRDGFAECPETGIPLPPEAREFLAKVLAGEDAQAEKIIEDLLAQGMAIRDVYLTIFQPVLSETGRLWQIGKISIAQEHHASAIIHRILGLLHNRIPHRRTGPRGQKTVVAACVGSELHDIGIRMVADFFEMDGWKVYLTGANTPPESILQTVRERNADAVALSVTMPDRLSDLWYLVRSLRAGPDTAPVRIIVGGHPFALVPDLWKQIGADAFAPDAGEAVAAADRLTT